LSVGKRPSRQEALLPLPPINELSGVVITSDGAIRVSITPTPEQWLALAGIGVLIAGSGLQPVAPSEK
jgi:hypothetical protein